MHSTPHALAPTGFGLSRSFVESLITVVPKLYSAVARPSNSSSRSPCTPVGGGDCDGRGESGACAFTLVVSGGEDMVSLRRETVVTNKNAIRVRVSKLHTIHRPQVKRLIQLLFQVRHASS